MPGRIGEILRNCVKEKLLRDEVVASMTVRLVRGIEIARIAKTAGEDQLMFSSHVPIGDRSKISLCQQYVTRMMLPEKTLG